MVFVRVDAKLYFTRLIKSLGGPCSTFNGPYQPLASSPDREKLQATALKLSSRWPGVLILRTRSAVALQGPVARAGRQPVNNSGADSSRANQPSPHRGHSDLKSPWILNGSNTERAPLAALRGLASNMRTRNEVLPSRLMTDETLFRPCTRDRSPFDRQQLHRLAQTD